eukprot:TRINITY_DN3541_c0_g1_i1.p1 TRINITY_DN3541_c0_g1~~TRINITY_DN3541_c0_g1_i1.p1  ORF type:complete len:106 (+),score=19.49 TRINITY_DN3541_c0_g1_i1:97-414(+)
MTGCPGSCHFLLPLLFAVFFPPHNLVESRSVLLPSPQCHPSIVQSMPDRYRKICDALATILDLSDAMENYIDEKVLLEILDQYLVGGDVDPRENDLDHVFLRFGR